MPCSGSAWDYSVIGQTEGANFKMIGDQGGVNERKVEFISYDDAYSPRETVERSNRLVEDDDVLQVKVQQETMMIGRPTTEGLAQFLGRSLDPPIGQRRQLDRISLARNQRLDHRYKTAANQTVRQ
jgi:hypothetical protein